MVVARAIEGQVEPFYRRMVRVEDCLCPDGVRRTARITGEPDTFFSIPASVKVRGVRVSGFVAGRETEEGERDYEFLPYTYRKNAWVFPEGVLVTGARYEHVAHDNPDFVYATGVISHWYWDERPYYQGKPRWLVIISYDWLNPEVYGENPGFVGPDGYWQQMDAANLMRCIYNKTVRVSGGRIIGPREWEGGYNRG
jgi:hypothetical protein